MATISHMNAPGAAAGGAGAGVDHGESHDTAKHSLIKDRGAAAAIAAPQAAASGALAGRSAPPRQQMMAIPGGLGDSMVADLHARGYIKNSNIWLPHPLDICGFILPCMWCGWCTQVDVSTAKVVLSCGRLVAVLEEPGLYFVGPCTTGDTRVVSTKRQAIDLPNIGVLDKTGSPLVVSGVVNYQVRDPVAATMNVQNVQKFVTAQAIATMKVVCKRFRYTSSDPAEVTLKGETHRVTELLASEMNRRCAPTGAHIDGVSLTDIAYRADIASGMLAVQAADARIQARKHIVSGAVDIASTALTRLRQGGLSVPESERFRFVRDLLPIISGTSAVQPMYSVG